MMAMAGSSEDFEFKKESVVRGHHVYKDTVYMDATPE